MSAQAAQRAHPVSSAAGHLNEYMSDCRALVVDEIRRFIPCDTKYGAHLYDLVLDYPLREAKALRPSLCVATCRALGGQLEHVLTSAAVLELFHNAFLIHDDVEDASERRRDAPTLHRSFGAPIAINVGDAMLALALEPLLENTRLLGLGRALKIMKVVSRMARETVEGQALELGWIRDQNFTQRDADYVRMVYKKTAWYTFMAPAIIGAIVAGSLPERIAALQFFSMVLGVAFQVQDDILNLVADESRYGKEIKGDLWEGKHTLILLHAIRSASSRERQRALRILAKPRPSENPEGEPTRSKTGEDVDFLHSLVVRHASIDYAREFALRRAGRARRLLDRLMKDVAPSPHRDFLVALTDYVVRRDR